MNSMRRWLALFLAVVLAAAVCLLPLPRPIHVTHAALAWRCGDSTYSETTEITINGTYFDYLLKEDFFDGAITASGFPETQRPLPRVSFHDGMGFLFYRGETGLLESTFGWIIMPPDGSTCVIGVHEEHGWSGDTGLMISAPAGSRQEAAALANRLCRQYSPDFLGNWVLE